MMVCRDHEPNVVAGFLFGVQNKIKMDDQPFGC